MLAVNDANNGNKCGGGIYPGDFCNPPADADRDPDPYPGSDGNRDPDSNPRADGDPDTDSGTHHDTDLNPDTDSYPCTGSNKVNRLC